MSCVGVTANLGNNAKVLRLGRPTPLKATLDTEHASATRRVRQSRLKHTPCRGLSLVGGSLSGTPRARDAEIEKRHDR